MGSIFEHQWIKWVKAKPKVPLVLTSMVMIDLEWLLDFFSGD